ncbi:MAG: putative signal transduction protein [Clostridia bacterium]|jgi:diguanylate cyclase (GGDEF)-like protein|nr:putative signal transduction protein [Clostridia bacterium]
MNEFDIIADKVKLFEKMYDVMRIVDPMKKEVLELKEGVLCKIESECYKLWKANVICENCVSIRAYNEDNTFIKMEYSSNKIFMITAVPISIHRKKFVIELLKDATNSLLMQNGEYGCEMKMLSTIEQMNRILVKDELTNLYNRRFINERLPVDLLKSSLENKPLSIIFADIDFFKSINDTYGHPAGDQLLREFADELQRHIRSGKDWAARYGGEEFLICLSDSDIDAARVVADTIRKSIMKKEFVLGNERVHVTCSFGVHTVCDGYECLTVDGVIEIADRNLYKAKAEGRNRVM